ncbi:MAG: rane protein, partial [Nocardioides sp.]|nr:rane protein [Nocardioides sp.]
MATLLYRLGKTAFRRWPLFVAAWIVAMVVVGAVAGTMSKPMTDAFSIPGIPSEKAADLQSELFPDAVDAFDQASVNVVVAAPRGHELAEPRYAAAVDDLVAAIAASPQVPADAPLANPVTAAAD